MATPFGLTLPDTVAPEVVTDPATVLVTDGGTCPVVNVRSGPFVVPPALTATTRAWYVVDGARPVSGTLTATAADPDPAEVTVVCDP